MNRDRLTELLILEADGGLSGADAILLRRLLEQDPLDRSGRVTHLLFRHGGAQRFHHLIRLRKAAWEGPLRLRMPPEAAFPTHGE